MKSTLDLLKDSLDVGEINLKRTKVYFFYHQSFFGESMCEISNSPMRWALLVDRDRPLVCVHDTMILEDISGVFLEVREAACAIVGDAPRVRVRRVLVGESFRRGETNCLASHEDGTKVRVARYAQWERTIMTLAKVKAVTGSNARLCPTPPAEEMMMRMKSGVRYPEMKCAR